MIILVQTLILFLKHICALHFIHSFEHSHTSHLVYKIFFVITFSSQCALHCSFSSHACISARTLVSIRKSITTSSRYNILTIRSILYLNYIISMPCIFIWLLHLCLSREPYLFEAIQNVRNISLSLAELSSSVGPLDTITHSFYNHILSREPYLFETVQNVRNIPLSILRQSTSINKSSLILYQ